MIETHTTSKGPPFTLGSVKRSVDVPVVQQILDFQISAVIEQQHGSRSRREWSVYAILDLNFDVVIFDHNLVTMDTLRSGWAQDIPCLEFVLCPMPWTGNRRSLDLAFG